MKEDRLIAVSVFLRSIGASRFTGIERIFSLNLHSVYQ